MPQRHDISLAASVALLAPLCLAAVAPPVAAAPATSPTSSTESSQAASPRSAGGVVNLFHPDCAAAYRLTEDRMRGACVARIHTILNTSHGFGLQADGSYGPNTGAAVRIYQRTHGLTVDGVAGPATMLKLESESGSQRDRVVSYALKAHRGHAMGNAMLGRWNGGRINYGPDTGGGHGINPGPSGDDPWSPDPNNGFIDCSGFTRWAYPLAYGTSGQMSPHGRWPTENTAALAPRTRTLKPGDLVVWRQPTNGHVAMYLGNGEVVHSIDDGPTTDRLSDLDRRFAGYTRTQHGLF